MPTYKNAITLPPDTQVWHYTDFKAVIAMWRDKQMRLTRLDAFKDPFEGSVPKQDIDNQLPIYAARTVPGKERALMPVQPSDQAPRFPVSLADYRGYRLVLIFIRHFACLPCQEHLMEVQDSLSTHSR